MDKGEQPKPELDSIEPFLIEKKPITQFPKSLSFNSPNLTRNLLEFANLPETKDGHEVGGVLYLDPSDNLVLHKLSTGTEEGVDMYFMDITNWPNGEITKFVTYYRNRPPDFPEFILVPPDFPLGGENSENLTIKNGKQILGSVHTHPKGNPPSPMDFSIMLHSDDERNYGVFSGNNLYMFVQSKETLTLEVKPSNTGWPTTLHEFGANLEDEVLVLENGGLSPTEARMQMLISQCQKYNVGFYYGDIRKNILERMA